MQKKWIDMMVDCPLCSAKWPAGVTSDATILQHVLECHLPRVQFSANSYLARSSTDRRKCWCGYQVESFFDFVRHVGVDGGLVSHFLLHHVGE